MREPSRRRFLRRAGAAVGAAGLLGAAGCSESPDGSVETADPPSQPAPTPTKTPGETPTDGSPTATETRSIDPLDGSWPSFRRDAANTGAAADPGPGPDPTDVWTSTVSAGEPASPPTAGDGAVVFVTESGVVRALSASGSIHWTGERAARTDVGPVVADGTAVVGTEEGLAGLATDDGGERWTAALDGEVLGLVTDGSRVVAATDRAVTAVSATDGNEQWRHAVDGSVSTGPGVGDASAGGGGTVAGDANAAGGDATVAVGLSSGDVLAIDAASGDGRWRESVGDGELEWAPAVGVGGVYVVAGTQVRAFETADGSDSWTVGTDYPVRGPPVATGDAVYAGTLDENRDATPPPEDGRTPTPYPTDTYGYGAVIRSLDPDDGGERWRRTLTGKWYFTAGPPTIRLGVAGGRLLVGIQSTLSALDTADGERLWAARHDRRGFAATDGVVSTGSRAVALDDGSERWTYESSDNVGAAPAVVGNTAYVGTDDQRVYALAANSGAIEWSARTDGLVRAAPAVDEDTVYTGTQEGTLYAFDRADGSELWTFDTGGTVSWAPALSDGTLYVGNFDATLIAVDAADGTELWRAEPGGRFVTGAPAVGDGAVYAGANGVVKAFETADGSERWGHTFGERGRVQSDPAAAGGRVYVFVGESLYAFDTASGAEVWARETGRSSSAPAVRDGVVYGCGDETMYAFDAADGTKRWETPVGEDHRVVAGDGAVYGVHYRAPGVALDPEDGSELWRRRDLTASTAPALAGEFLLVGTDEGAVRAFGPRE